MLDVQPQVFYIITVDTMYNIFMFIFQWPVITHKCSRIIIFTMDIITKMNLFAFGVAI